jgi:hypothetical protein
MHNRGAPFVGEPADLEPLVGKMKVVTRLLGCSPSTVRRRMKSDPSFPKPFRDRPTDDWEWLLGEIKAYALARAARRDEGSPEAALTLGHLHGAPRAVANGRSPGAGTPPSQQGIAGAPSNLQETLLVRGARVRR